MTMFSNRSATLTKLPLLLAFALVTVTSQAPAVVVVSDVDFTTVVREFRKNVEKWRKASPNKAAALVPEPEITALANGLAECLETTKRTLPKEPKPVTLDYAKQYQQAALAAETCLHGALGRFAEKVLQLKFPKTPYKPCEPKPKLLRQHGLPV